MHVMAMYYSCSFSALYFLPFYSPIVLLYTILLLLSMYLYFRYFPPFPLFHKNYPPTYLLLYSPRYRSSFPFHGLALSVCFCVVLCPLFFLLPPSLFSFLSILYSSSCSLSVSFPLFLTPLYNSSFPLPSLILTSSCFSPCPFSLCPLSLCVPVSSALHAASFSRLPS